MNELKPAPSNSPSAYAPESVLDVYLRGGRDYIQGTQIIARIAETLPEAHWTLRRAEFARITGSRVAISETIPGRDALGSVEFLHSHEAPRRFFLVDTHLPAPRRDDPLGIHVLRIDGSNPPDSAYVFDGVRDIEDMLNVLVQATKGEHERRFVGCHDIWLTGFRNTSLDTGWSGPREGVVLLSLFRQLGAAPQFQTVWMFEAQGAERVRIASGAITFAYKLGSRSDAP